MKIKRESACGWKAAAIEGARANDEGTWMVCEPAWSSVTARREQPGIRASAAQVSSPAVYRAGDAPEAQTKRSTEHIGSFSSWEKERIDRAKREAVGEDCDVWSCRDTRVVARTIHSRHIAHSVAAGTYAFERRVPL